MKPLKIVSPFVLAACLLLLSNHLLAVTTPDTVAKTASRSSTAAKQAPSAPVDVNTATIPELTTIPGIGKALAQRIVEFREKNGPFGQVADLVKVRGIGEKSFQKLRPYVTVSASKTR